MSRTYRTTLYLLFEGQIKPIKTITAILEELREESLEKRFRFISGDAFMRRQVATSLCRYCASFQE